MSPWDAFHLPGTDIPAEGRGQHDAHAAASWRDLGATGLRVPILEQDAVQAVWHHLDTAAAAWRAQPLAVRTERIATALAHLRRQGARAWRDDLGRSTGLSPAGVDAAWEATFAPHTQAALHEALAREGVDDSRLVHLSRQGRLPLRLVHVLAGNVLPPTLSVLLRGWLLGAAQWLRPAEREPLFALCLLEALQPLLPDLVASTAVLWWPHEGGAMQDAVLSQADALTVQGSDDAVRALQARLAALSRPAHLVGYGSRWSGALVALAAQTPASAAALARDVALFDQQGCLSPTLVFAQAGGHLEGWCGEIAAALAREEERQPRGALPPEAEAGLRHWHELARLELVLGDLAGFWEAGTTWGVILLARCELHDTPLDRHVVVVPFDRVETIAAVLGDEGARLQGMSVALDAWSAAERASALAALRPTRVAPLGELQAAPLGWPQDHHPPFASLWMPGPAGRQS